MRGKEVAMLRLQIRFAEKSDLSQARQILRKFFTGSYLYWSDLLLGRLDTLVAVVNRRVVGVAELYTRDTESHGRIGVIGFIAVDPEYRGRGIGKRLVGEAERISRERGCSYSAASTRHDNTVSIRMFTGMGYKLYRWGEKEFDELEGPLYAYEDDVILVKKLV